LNEIRGGQRKSAQRQEADVDFDEQEAANDRAGSEQPRARGLTPYSRDDKNQCRPQDSNQASGMHWLIPPSRMAR